MSQYKFSLISPEELGRDRLFEVRHLIVRAAQYNHGYLTVDDYIDSVMAGGMQLWLDTNVETGESRGVGITCLETTDNDEKLVRVLLYSHESTASYLSNAKQFEEWCLRFGASEVEFWGREGWKRALRPLGYEVKCIVLRKRIGEQHE